MKIVYENWSSQVFPGFYHSFFSDPLESELCQDGYYLDIANYSKYQKLVCEQYVACIQFIDNPLDMKILRYEGLRSPREYNFHTDKIQISIDINMHKLKEYCWRENTEDFANYLRKEWSSRPGFWSFIPDSLIAFIGEYKENPCKRAELQQVMIEYYLLKNVDFGEVEMDVYEYCHELACEAGVVLMDNKGNTYDYEYDDMTDMIIPISKSIKQIA